MKDIEQFLRENAPETPDEGQFLIETNARLSAVEGIKQTVDGEHRRWRRAVLIALAASLLLGCALTALVLLYPVKIDDSFLTRAIQSLQPWKNYLIAFIALCSISLGVLSVKREGSVL